MGISSLNLKMESYRAMIEESYRAEATLRMHIIQLTRRCHEMDATISSLDKVRDAIHVLGVCPGMGRLEFPLPVWMGVWAEGNFDTISMSDAEVDEEMDALCARQSSDQKLRAAETSEIMLRTIEKAPKVNPARVPLMGTCPNCEGDEDDPDGTQHVSGHARVCWDTAAPLSATSKRTGCSAGKKAVLCVVEGLANTGPTSDDAVTFNQQSIVHAN